MIFPLLRYKEYEIVIVNSDKIAQAFDDLVAEMNRIYSTEIFEREFQTNTNRPIGLCHSCHKEIYDSDDYRTFEDGIYFHDVCFVEYSKGKFLGICKHCGEPIGIDEWDECSEDYDECSYCVEDIDDWDYEENE